VSNKSHMRDDWIDVPLGMCTMNGMCAACFLVHGDVADKKIPMHHKFIIAVSSVVAVKMAGIQSKINAN
jgi:hypothetical protein